MRYPLRGEREIHVSKVADLLALISKSQYPAVSFNPVVLKKSFGLGYLLTYLCCDLALLVGSKQEMWNKYHSLVPLKIWNCREPMIYGKLQALSMTAGTLEENAKLLPCVLQWLKADEARSNTARLGDLTLAIQTSQVRRRIRTASPGQDGPSLDQSVSGLDLNAAVGFTSYSNDDLWRTNGP